MSRGGASAAKTSAEREAEQRANEIYRGILSRTPEHDFDPTIERVRSVIELLGDPQRSFRAIHLTGTNGKTSTARMIERLVREMGLRTGRFTSPHLSTVRERIAIDGEPISPERFVEVWEDIAPYVAMVDARLAAEGQSQLSFFEVLTALAYAAFADAPVDVAVIEVGMGGEWDSTNVVDAEVAVLTPIDRDHERWLGHDLESIATVKSGIIKNGAIVVSADQREEVRPVIAEAADRQGARLISEAVDIAVVDRQVAVGGQLMSLQGIGGAYTDIAMPLHGAHQAHNALLALTAVEAFFGGSALDADVVERAFADVDSPGRLELVRSSPTVIVDAAHNPAGAQVLVDALGEAFHLSRVVGVLGVMADKDVEGILATLEPALAEIVVTQASSARAMDVEDVAEIARDVFGEDRVHVAERLDDAVALAADLAESGDEMPGVGVGSGVVALGSIVLVAEVRTLFGR